MIRINSFAPIANRNASVLILGSMPGAASLAAREYYAHPRNAFWSIMAQLLQFNIASPYAVRVQALHRAHIAVWDVLKSCARNGSLDAMIEAETEVPNDFEAFFLAHAGITRVYFNGAKAESSFRRHVVRLENPDTMQYLRLPSTSPANASMSYARKLEAWRSCLMTGLLAACLAQVVFQAPAQAATPTHYIAPGEFEPQEYIWLSWIEKGSLGSAPFSDVALDVMRAITPYVNVRLMYSRLTAEDAAFFGPYALSPAAAEARLRKRLEHEGIDLTRVELFYYAQPFRSP
jgi:double-stranded uracil-DNA glycosylase